MKKLLFSLLSFLLLSQTISAQCNSTSGGRVCNSNITFTGHGYLTSTDYWKSVKITQGGYHSWQLYDSTNLSNSNYFWEFRTCSKEDLQLQISTGTYTIKRNLNTLNCNGTNANDERVVIQGSTGVSIKVLGDSCNPTTDTFTLYYKRLFVFPKSEGNFGSGNWLASVYNYDGSYTGSDLATTTTGSYYMGSYGTENKDFTNDFGTGQAPLNGNCPMCPDSTTDNNTWGIVYRMLYGYSGGANSSFYHVTSNTPNDLWVSSMGGGNHNIFNCWSTGSSYSSKAVTILLDSTSTNDGKWVYQTKKNTGNLKADITICKMDGNYSFGNGEWKAYVFDGITTPATSAYKTTTYDNYNGTYTNNAFFYNNFGTGQPSMTGQRCGVSMDNDSFYVSYKMKINLTAGKYKFRVRSEDGGYLQFQNAAGTNKGYILNPGSTGSYDLTSSYYTLSGDTFLFLRLYEYTSTSRISYIHCREPKNPGGIHASKDTICSGSAVTLTADTADGTETQWYVKGCGSSAGYVGSGASITVTIDSSTTFYVRNRSYSVAGSDTANVLDIYSPSCASKRIIMLTLPSNPANPTSNSPQCSTTGVTLTRTGTPPSGETWYWQTASTDTATTASGSTYTATSSGNKYIRAKNNTSTCWSSGAGNTSVTVNATPAAPTAVTPSSATAICNGSNLNLNATSSGNTIYWFITSSGGTSIGSSSSGANYSVTPSSSVTCYAQAQTGAGCVSSSRTATGAITVNANPSAPAAPAPQSFCSDSAHTFTFSNVTAGAGGNQIEWALNSAFTSSTTVSSGSTISVTVNGGNVDTVWLRSKVSGSGCASNSNLTLAVVLPENRFRVITDYTPQGVETKCIFSPEDVYQRNQNGANYLTPVGSSFGQYDCGRFRVIYLDIINYTGEGFADPNLGAARRDVVCQVLTYIQSIFEIPSGDGSQIEIQFEQSYTPSNPSPYQNVLANATPVFQQLLSNTIVNGNLFDHFTTGNDPNTLQVDAALTVNFSYSYNDDLTASFDPCKYDLYSVILHELTHDLGFFSLIWKSVTSNVPVATNNVFSRFDNLFLYYGDMTGNGPFEKVVTLNFPSPPVFCQVPLFWNNYKVWLENKGVNFSNPSYDNNPMSCVNNANASHFAYDYPAYLTQLNLSPGFEPEYVMRESGSPGKILRSYSVQELRILNMLGYQFKNSFLSDNSINSSYSNSSIIQNILPFYSKRFNYDPFGNTIQELTAHETISPDFTITDCTPLLIDISALPSVRGQVGEGRKIYPGSLFNIRGCGINGNNHDALVISSNSNGDQIVYTPRNNFFGRAQFGFQLWDGKEPGSFVLITIDVDRSRPCFNNPGNLILNGDFEEGTEVRTLTNQNVENGFLQSKEGYFMNGVQISDAQPVGYGSNVLAIQGTTSSQILSGGVIIQGSSKSCTDLGTYLGRFGNVSTSAVPPGTVNFNGAFFSKGPFPAPAASVGGSRYCSSDNYATNVFSLSEDLLNCNYKLSFLANTEAFNGYSGGSGSIEISGYNSMIFPDYLANPVWQRSDFISLPAYNVGWQTVSVNFHECATIPVKYLVIDFSSPFANSNLSLDNFILEVDPVPPPALTVDAGNDVAIPNCSYSVQLNVAVQNPLCSLQYHWSPSSSLSSPSIANPIASVSSPTTFTVEVNDGCRTASDQVVITPSSIPTAEAGNGELVCTALPFSTQLGGSPTAANGTPPYSYIWSTSSGNLNSTTIPNPTFTISQNGVYHISVSVTDFSGCVASDLVDFATPSAYIIGTNSINTCVGNSAVQLSTTSNIANPAYIWNDGTPLNLSSNYALYPGTYIVTVTDHSGCSVTADYIVTGNSTCCQGTQISTSPLKTYTYSSTDYPTLSSIPSVVLYGSNLNIALNGNFAVGGSVALREVFVEMGSNSKITVGNGEQLLIQSSTLEACNEMWDGIYVEGTGTLSVNDVWGSGYTSKIEDAVNGIVLKSSNSNAYIEQTHFSNNLRSIQIINCHPTVTIKGNYFDFNTSMKPIPTGSPYLAHSHPDAGVYIFGCPSIAFPLSGQAANTFEYLNCGVAVINSTADLGENYFKHIKNYEGGGFNPSYYGSGVYGGLSGSFPSLQSLSVHTSTSTPINASPFYFDDCAYGIRASRINLSAFRNRMNAVTNGIHTQSCLGKSVLAENNYITATNFGITLNNNTSSTQTIDGNTIEVNDPTSTFVYGSLPTILNINTYGIYQSEVNNAVPVNASIYDNHITDGRTCIGLLNANGTQIFNNDVHLSSTTSIKGRQAGIYSSNCRNLLIEENTAEGNSNTYTDILASNPMPIYSAYRKSGIWLNNTLSGDVCGNTLGHTTLTSKGIGYGMYYTANCSEVNIYTNIMNLNKFGIALQGAGISAILKDNMGSNDQSNAYGHQNVFNGDGNGTNHFFNNSSNYRTYSFVTSYGYNPPIFWYKSPQQTSNKEYSDPSGAINPAKQVQARLITASPFNTYTHVCTPIQATYSSSAHNSRSLFVTDIASDSSSKYMEEGYETEGGWLAERMLYSILKEDTAWVNSDSLLSAFYTTKTAEDIGDIAQYENKLKEMADSTTLADSALYTQSLSGAEVLNKLINTTNVQAANFVLVNNIYMDMLNSNKDTFTTTQISKLDSIASLCPYSGGDAVFIARALRTRANNDIFYDDVEICAPAEYETSGKREDETAVKKEDEIKPQPIEFVTVFPNPTSNEINLVYFAKTKGTVQLEITDQLGQVVKLIQVEAYSGKYSVQNINSGVYYWRLRDSERILSSGKLAVIK